jgi:hypothetical protein
MILASLLERFTVIEECYEYMLAYAAQGVPDGGPIRSVLERAREALDGLVEQCLSTIGEEDLQPVTKYTAYLKVLDRDARDTRAAIDLVLAQPVISSQFVNNLNASAHFRALLTDLLFLAEVFRAAVSACDAEPA